MEFYEPRILILVITPTMNNAAFNSKQPGLKPLTISNK